jgi:C1A family cysteine protease
MHLSMYMQGVKDQGQLGACTAFTGSEDLEALEAQYFNGKVILSPMFLYYIERQLNGTLAQGDCGSNGETSCQAIEQFGICLETEDAYSPSNFQVAPTAAQLQEAMSYRAGAWHTISNLQDLMTCINSGYRVRMGMDVYQSFEDIGADGLMPIPNPQTEQMLGGHETLIYGYDSSVKCPGANAAGAFRVRNSWGINFGVSGDYWAPFELMTPDSVIQPDFKIQHFGGPWHG